MKWTLAGRMLRLLAAAIPLGIGHSPHNTQLFCSEINEYMYTFLFFLYRYPGDNEAGKSAEHARFVKDNEPALGPATRLQRSPPLVWSLSLLSAGLDLPLLCNKSEALPSPRHDCCPRALRGAQLPLEARRAAYKCLSVGGVLQAAQLRTLPCGGIPLVPSEASSGTMATRLKFPLQST